MSSSPSQFDPHALDGDRLNLEMERALGELTPAEMEKIANVRPVLRPRENEHGKVQGRIVEIRGDTVYVDIGSKSEAFLPLNEFPEDRRPAAGEPYEFVMHGLDADSGLMRLSLREVRIGADIETVRIGDVVEGRVTGVNIGGLELNCQGLRGFMPRSQVDLQRIEDFAPFIGRTLECEVTEVNRRGRSVVVSRRRVLERHREQQREELRGELAEGQVHQGVVRRLTDFGAFVDLGGIEGLLHISDISYGRLKHPSEALKEGDQITVQIRKVDTIKDRISLGMKQLQPDPWTVVPANYHAGQTVDARVLSLQNFGAFVELQPGVEGLIPISEMSWVQRVRHPRDVLKEGDPVRCAILDLNPEQRKITLSLKALSADPWTTAAERYKPDEEVTGRVTNLVEYGAFVQLEEGVEGLVHISEMSDKRIHKPDDVCKVGEVVQVRVKSVDVAQRRVSLSMRPKVDRAAHAQAASRAAQPEPVVASVAKKKRPLKGGLDF